MKIIMITWKCFGMDDIIDAFQELGHETILHPFDDSGAKSDELLKQELLHTIKTTSPDCIFSFNYFPIVALTCLEQSLPYLSWIYDSPYVRMYHYSINSPTNHVFTFDKEQYLEFHNAGIQTVHYLPMAANTTRLAAMTDIEAFRKTPWYNQHPVAFIGSLYTEKHQFFQRMDKLSNYTKGYLDGLMAAQKQVYGYNFIQELLPQPIIQDMQHSLPMHTGSDSVESIEYLFAHYVINRQITALERQDLLQAVASRFSLDLYTPDPSIQWKGCTNHGPVDYYDYAPYVFRQAKINLNISLRSILSGIPLRAFDIMGAGGFLMSNFQADFLDDFVPGEDFVFYESKTDLLDKIAYYLANEEERCQIAQNGFQKVVSNHSYIHRAKEMLEIL